MFMFPNETTLQDYSVLRNAAGYVSCPARTLIKVSGADAAKFLHAFCTNDVQNLNDNNSCEAFVCNVKGHTVGHVQILRKNADFWIETTAEQAATLIPFWDRYVIREQVVFQDESENYVAIDLNGQQLSQKLETISLPEPSLRFPLNGREYAQLLFVSHESWPRIQQEFQRVGIQECQSAAAEMLRVEEGFPLFGIDITADNLPQEVDRNGYAIHFKKGCYLGQETVARIDALGQVNYYLRGLTFAADATPAVGDQIFVAEKPVARIASVAWSPRAETVIALAYVRREFAKNNTAIASATVFSWPHSEK
jgi:tRNA-modifying protein YgfZ